MWCSTPETSIKSNCRPIGAKRMMSACANSILVETILVRHALCVTETCKLKSIARKRDFGESRAKSSAKRPVPQPAMRTSSA